MRTPYLPAAIAQLNPSRWTEPFWQGAKEHRLLVARCAQCGALRMPPGPCCERCKSEPLDWFAVPGTGRVHTFTVTRRAFHSALGDALPYVLGVVELDDAEGARLISTIVEVDPASVHVGLPVEVVWDDVTDEVTLPRFRGR